MTPDVAEYRATIPFASGVAGLVRRAIDADTDGLRTMILGMIRSNTPPPREVFIKPNRDGTWPTITRDANNPGTLMWLRHLDATTLAPIPAAANGYLPTDLLFPGEGTGGAVVVPKGVFASDSLTSASIVQAQDYTGDAYAGGQPITWAVDKSRGAGNLVDRRARIGTTGLDVYDGVFAYTTWPAMPTSGALRSTFTISTLAARNWFAYDLRGPSIGSTQAVRLYMDSSTDGASIAYKIEGGGMSTPLGSVPFTPGQTVVQIDDDGATQIKVTVGSTVLGTATVPTGRGNYAAFYAGAYSYFVVKNLKIEVV